MKSDEERKDPNQILIPRDIGDMSKRRKKIYGRAGMPTHTPDGVAPTYLGSSTEDSKNHGNAPAPDDAATEAANQPNEDEDATSAAPNEDYTKTYLKKQRETEEKRKEEQNTKTEDDALAKSKLSEEETMQRTQAREIQNQMRIWESRKGQPGYEDTQVDGMVSSLKGQLGGIDPKYWY